MRRNSPASQLLKLSLFALLLSGCRDARARTLYVAPGGDNAGAGTREEPLADPAGALRVAVPGDTIILRAGRYEIAKPLLVAKAGLTITAAPGEAVAIQAPATDAGGVAHVFVVTASKVTLADLEIKGGSYYGVKIDVDEGKTPTRGVTIRGCRIGGTGRDCVKTFNADQLLIENCEIGPSGLRDPSNAEGIDSIGSHGVTIRGCKVRETATNGIYLKGGATDGVVENCLIENIHSATGILLGQDTDLEFMRDGVKYEAIRCVARNNIVVNTGGSGVGTYAGDSIQFLNNTLYNVARESGAGVWVGVNSRKVGARNVAIKNNVVVNSSRRPLVFFLNTDGVPSADNNIYFTTNSIGRFQIERDGKVSSLAFKSWQERTNADVHSLYTEPKLDVANQYRPLPGSPVLDRGLAVEGVAADYSGVSRPKHGAVDIGAYEGAG